MSKTSETLLHMPTTPVIGFILAAAHVMLGSLLNLRTDEASVPLLYMQLLQAGAWVMAIIAGGFTAYGVWRTHHGKKKRKT
jgi:hypothetical protein